MIAVAQAMGLKVGDVINRVNGEMVAASACDGVARMIRYFS